MSRPARERVVTPPLIRPHPRHETWAAEMTDEGGTTVYGTWTPATSEFRVVTPAEDAALPGLAHWSTRGRLLGHRPGRRAVVATANGRFVKILPVKRARRLLDRLALLEESPFPRRDDEYVGEGVIIFERAAGTALHEVTTSGAIAAVGRFLATMQHRDVAEGLPVQAPQDPAPWLALGHLEPVDVHGALSSLAGSPHVVVHGDLHDKNVFVDGESVMLIDPDALHAGHPAEDPGNLAAHLVLRGFQRGHDGRAHAAALIDAYLEAGGTARRADIEIVAGLTFLRLAALYGFRERWRGLVPRLIDEGRARMGAPRTSTFTESLVEALGGRVVSARETYRRSKPDASTLVGLAFMDDAGDEHLGYLKTWVAEERADAAAAKWCGRRADATPLGAGVRRWQANGLLFLFPNDAVLRGLEKVVDADKLKRMLALLPAFAERGLRIKARGSSFGILRYKPERRLVMSADLALIHRETRARERKKLVLRFFPDERGAGLDAVTAALHAHAPHTVPEPLGTLLDGRLQVERMIETTRDEIIHRGTEVGEALALVQSAMPPTALAPQAAGWGLDRADASLSRLSATGSIDDLRGELHRRHGPAAPGDVTVVHGDMHLHQLVLHEAGPVLVDFERAALGDAHQDIAGLRAHALVLAARRPEDAGDLERFASEALAAWSAARGGHAPDRLDWWTAAALTEQALLALRRHDVDGARDVTALALAVLRGER